MSLRTRIVVLVTALVAALLLLLGSRLLRELGQWTTSAADSALDARANEVLNAVHEESAEDLELHELAEHAGSMPLRIARPDGAVLYVSPGFPALSPAQLGAKRATVSSQAGAYRVLRVDEPSRRLVLHLAAPFDVLEEVVRLFTGSMLQLLALGVLLGGLLSALLAYVALRPLSRVARQIAAVDPGTSPSSLDASGLPSELVPVVTSFNGLLQRTSAALARERELVARASHALRTPVASVLSEAEVALRRERTVEEYRKALESVAGSARQSAALIRELLSLARADAQRPLEGEDVALAPVVEEIVALARARAAEKQISLTTAIPEGLRLRAEPAHLREALEALVDNALTYCPTGASAGIEARAGDFGVDVTVWDTGPGLPAEHRARAVERFWRGPGTAARPGSGLGLSLVDAVLRRHGGALSLEPNPGGGLRVVTHWPAAPTQ